MDEKLGKDFHVRITEDQQKQLAELPTNVRVRLYENVRVLINKTLYRPHCPVCGSRIGQCVPHKQVAILELKPEPEQQASEQETSQTENFRV
jgi:hypothetical protein